MFSHIYIEKEIAEHPRTLALCARFPQATRIPCERYGEVFNSRAQNFRLQKIQPALILAKKHSGLILKTPEGYGIGGELNFYFSHMLNCLYDCRYCFLQGMYRSAHYVMFVNFDDFGAGIDTVLMDNKGHSCWFFSGYDCDSLALEPVTGFCEHFLPFFAARPDAHLEIRTKSTQIRSLLKRDPLPNAVIAFSFTPEETSRALEHKVPALNRRLEAMQRLQNAGWIIGLRFDPLVYQQNYRKQYRGLFAQTLSNLNIDRLHSVSLGTFRLPRSYYRNILRLYPDEPFYAGPFAEKDGMVSYREELEDEMSAFCTRELLNYVPGEILCPCSAAA